MRILFVNDLPAIGGGKEKYLLAIAGMLAGAGHVSGLMHSVRNGLDAMKRDCDAITFCVPGLDALGKSADTVARVKEIAELFKPDIVHLHYNVRNLAALRWLVRRYPLLRSVHDVGYLCPTRYYLRADTHAQCDARCGAVCFSAGCLSPFHPRSVARLIKARITQRVFAKGTRLSTQSAYLQRHLLQTTEGRDVSVLPVFVDPVNSSPLSPNMRFLYVGRLHRLKGPQVAVRALIDLPPAIVLEIVGAGNQENELRHLVRQNRLENRVSFTGHLQGEALNERFRSAMCVLVPSIAPENCPLSVQEAMAFGRPVIASNVGGIPDLVTDGVTGYLIPPDDSKALGAAMMRLCADPRLASTLGLNGLKNISEPKYSRQFHLQELLKEYDATIRSFQMRIINRAAN